MEAGHVSQSSKLCDSGNNILFIYKLKRGKQNG